MNFQIKNIILWPTNDRYPYKVINFEIDKINVITGASRTGKSAIIPIIDYCLGSGSCRIPVDIIRKTCSWFGIIIKTDNSEILLARPGPQKQQITTNMYMQESEEVSIPDNPEKNTTSRAVIEYLNTKSLITSSELDDIAFADKPSFRDLAAFIFQPQNIVTNPNTLFYKTDSYEHKTKLINLFPYILGAVTAEILAKRQEVTRLQRILDKESKELEAKKQSANKWITEINGWLSAATEIGLIEKIEKELSFNEQVKLLETISSKRASDAKVLASRLEDSSKEIINLRQEEYEISSKLGILKKKYIEMSQLMKSVVDYKTSLTVQIERLSISKWLKEHIEPQDVIPISRIDEFCNALENLENETKHIDKIPVAFEREYADLKKEIDKQTEKLKAVQNRIRIQSTLVDSLSNEKYTLENISRFIGQIQRVTETFKYINDNSDSNKRIRFLKEKINNLKIDINTTIIDNKINAALKNVNNYAMSLIKLLDSEWPNDPIKFDRNNLTIVVERSDGRKDYLWEIGSGSNWLSYHVAITLAFQLFFSNMLKHSPVPNFIIYDQPSQVYFPSKLAYKNDESDPQLADEDKIAVKKIFNTMAETLKLTKKPLQIIVLEHADDTVWGDVEHINKVDEWRNGKKLIPEEWIE